MINKQQQTTNTHKNLKPPPNQIKLNKIRNLALFYFEG